MFGTEKFTIHDIEKMTEAEAFFYAEEKQEIKGHSVYFVDFGGYFGYSCLVFCNAHHIYYANDYQLHHRFMQYDDDGTKEEKCPSKSELRALFIEKLNNILFTEAEIIGPVKDYFVVPAT